MKRIERLLGRLEFAGSALGAACVVMMMLQVTADVAGRYLANPLPGTITIVSHYYMVALAFLPLVVAEQRGAHVSVDIVFNRLPPAARRLLAAANHLFVTVILALLATRSFEIALDKTRLGAAVEQGTTILPLWPSYWLVPLGATMMAVITTVRFLAAFLGAGDAEAEAITSAGGTS